MSTVVHRSGPFVILLLLSGAGCAQTAARTDQPDARAPDLAALVQSGGLRTFNRNASVLEESTRRGVRLSQAPGDGLAWVEGLAFTTGTIELDLRGKNAPGQSFVGVAFNGADDTTYEAVYVRPFNFRADTPVQRDHSVQYIAHPAFTWNRLRSERPEVYENPVNPAPDGNDWVHLRLEVERGEVRVFVGEGDEPDLVVDRLAERHGSQVGLWVGNNSEGDFANLRIDPRQ